MRILTWHLRRVFRSVFGLTTEFVVRHVADTPGWYLDGAGRLRRHVERGEADPISSLGNAPAYEREAVAQKFRVNPISATIVTHASNNVGGPAQEVRERLLAAAEIA